MSSSTLKTKFERETNRKMPLPTIQNHAEYLSEPVASQIPSPTSVLTLQWRARMVRCEQLC